MIAIEKPKSNYMKKKSSTNMGQIKKEKKTRIYL